MSKEDIQTMENVTYFNDESGYWSFYGSESGNFETQKDAYDAFKNFQ